ncbi:MAG: hypothetical protein CMJ58_06095 [Planctomycetaceae bacterium]|nr:hypothetical protein [Planctomycetaceae bacterium]
MGVMSASGLGRVVPGSLLLRAAVVALATWTASFSRTARGEEFQWSGPSGAGAWNDSANWTNLTPGGVDLFPGADDDATIGVDVTTSAGAVANLTTTATLTVQANGDITIHGPAINNSGMLTLTPDGSNNIGGIPDTRLTIAGNASLTGGGQLVLTGNETGLTGAGVLTNVDNTIRGFGQIQVDLVNQATLRAEGGTLLVVDGKAIDNAAGAVEVAADGVLDLESSTLTGGQITGAAGSRWAGGTIADAALAGELQLLVNRGAGLSGAIANAGTITFAADSSNNIGNIPDTRIVVDAAATLTGNGSIVLTGSETGFTGAGVLTIVNNTIRGAGQIQVEVVNQGTLRAEGGTLAVIDGKAIDNAGGAIEAAADGVLDLGSSVTTGGLVSGAAGSRIAGGTIDGATLAGELTVAVNRGVAWAGTIANGGVVTFLEDNSDNIGGIPDTRISVDSTVSLSGGGSIVLTGSQTGLTGGGVLQNVDNTIVAGTNGVLQVAVENGASGVVAIGAGKRLVLLAPLSGGAVDSTATGLLAIGEAGALSDLSIAGELTLDIHNAAPLAGVITNTGALTFVADTFNNFGGVPDTRYSIADAATLAGGGTVALNGSETGFLGDGVLTNADNTIVGSGQIQVDLINRATVRAEGGSLTVVGGVAFDNASGTVEIAADGLLDLESSTLAGGSLTGAAGGKVAGGALASVTVAGTVTEAIHRSTTWTGAIANTGVLTLEPDTFNNFGGIPDTRYTITDAAALTGMGEVVLTGSDTGLTGAGVLTNVDNTIRGVGQIQVALVNQGTLRAEGGELLAVDGKPIDNAGGTVEIAADGVLDLQTSPLTGGEVVGAVGSRLAGGTIADAALSGELTIPVNRGVTWAGAIDNQGVVTFENDTFDNFGGLPDTRVAIATPVTLTGGGSIVLTGSETGLTGAGVLHNVDNTIYAGDSAMLDAAVQNGPAGVVAIEAGKRLSVLAPLSGGTLNAAATSLLTTSGGGSLSDLTVVGELTIDLHNGTPLAGAIHNTGVLTFVVDTFNNFGGIPDTRYTISGATTLTGGGVVALASFENGLVGSGVLTNADNTIEGLGQIQVELVNQGTLRAAGGLLSVTRSVTGAGAIDVTAGSEIEFSGALLTAGSVVIDPAGTFDFNGQRMELVDVTGDLPHDTGAYSPAIGVGSASISGDLQMSSPAELEVEFAGLDPGEYDLLTVGGDAELDGTFSVHVLEMLLPIGGSASRVVTTAGAIAGAFDAIPAPGTHVGYGVFIDSVTVDDVNALIEVALEQTRYPGDFDQDGDVDGVDLSLWNAGYGAQTGAVLGDGDADADGAVSGRDFMIWQLYHGSGVGDIASVPEPATAALLALAVIAATLITRCRPPQRCL